MSEQVTNQSVVQEIEQKVPAQSRLRNGHWRLQKALDILLNYLLELEKKNPTEDTDEKNLFP